MKKLPILLTVILIFFLSCESNQNISDKLNIVFENYYQESIAHLDQINASSKSKERLYGFADWLKNRDL